MGLPLAALHAQYHGGELHLRPAGQAGCHPSPRGSKGCGSPRRGDDAGAFVYCALPARAPAQARWRREGERHRLDDTYLHILFIIFALCVRETKSKIIHTYNERPPACGLRRLAMLE